MNFTVDFASCLNELFIPILVVICFYFVLSFAQREKFHRFNTECDSELLLLEVNEINGNVTFYAFD